MPKAMFTLFQARWRGNEVYDAHEDTLRCINFSNLFYSTFVRPHRPKPTTALAAQGCKEIKGLGLHKQSRLLSSRPCYCGRYIYTACAG